MVIHHDHCSSAGHVGTRLRERGYRLVEMTVVPEERYDTPDLDAAEAGFPADPTAWDLIVPLGAPWSVTRMNSWITAELRLLREAHHAGVPVLGICFGGQALAAALGGSVRPAGRFELGWTELEAQRPQLLGPGPWFQFHGDRFTLPEGAEELARNEVCPQAFTLGRSLGVQFHPELTPATLQSWFDNGGYALAAGAAGLDRAACDALVTGLAAATPDYRARTAALVDAFLAQVATTR
nr:type 1 glutamine amidotransferase [Streptomyces sp. HNM0574]